MGTTKQGFKILDYRAGERICREGDSGDYAFLIQKGTVSIYKNIEGRKNPLATLNAGQIFGEMAILTGQPRSASAEALEKCTVILIDESSLMQAMSASLPLVKKLMEQLLSRFRNMLAEKSKHDNNLKKIDVLKKTLQTIKKEISESKKSLGFVNEAQRKFLDRIQHSCEVVLKLEDSDFE